jgi:hypothetical protein
MQVAVNEPVVAQPPVAAVRGEPDTTAACAAAAQDASLLWKVWLPIPIFFLILEVTFHAYFWDIPKLTGRSADYGYQFLLDVHRLQQPKPSGTTRVVAFGSSVIGSFDRYQVESLIAAHEPNVRLEVHRLLLPGIKPSDARIFFAAQREAIQPDVVVLVVNLVDFLNPSFERDLKEQVRYVLPPWQTLRERGAYMPFSSKLDLVFAGSSDLYRYRKLIRSSLRDHLKLLPRWLRSRSTRGTYGIYPDGYAAPRFALPVDGAATTDLEYYVAPEWIAQRGQVALSFSADGRVLAQRTEDLPGWKTIRLPAPPQHQQLLEVRADSAWVPRASDAGDDWRLLSVRLRHIPPARPQVGAAPFRYPPVDQRQMDTFLRFGDPSAGSLAARWDALLQGDSEFAKRFRRYRELKVGVRDQVFRSTGEYGEFERLVRELSASGTAVVIVNSPESPWILKDYGDSAYYRAYRAFFEGLARYPGVSFHDLSGVLPAEDFNDWHHVNYVGAVKMGPHYAQFIAAALPVRRTIH